MSKDSLEIQPMYRVLVKGEHGENTTEKIIVGKPEKLESDCKACDGSGELDCSCNLGSCTQTVECPHCGGDGFDEDYDDEEREELENPIGFAIVFAGKVDRRIAYQTEASAEHALAILKGMPSEAVEALFMRSAA